MPQTQYKFERGRETNMLHKILYLKLALLITLSLLLVPSTLGNAHTRRRPTALTSAKKSIEEPTEKSSNPVSADQIASANSRSDGSKQRRSSVTARDFAYNNYELNLVRPEGSNAPLHAQITAKYTTHISTGGPPTSLEETETAEEYVSKAMQRFGSRFREPIRITGEQESSAAEATAGQSSDTKTTGSINSIVPSIGSSNKAFNSQKANRDYYDLYKKQQAQAQAEAQAQQEASANYPSEQQQQQQQQQFQPMQPQPQQQQHQQEQQVEQQYDAKALLEAQMQAQLQQQMQQAQLLAAHQTQQQQQQQQQEQQPVISETQTERIDSKVQGYEQDALTRSYEVYDAEANAYENPSQGQVDRHYRTKYVYQPSYRAVLTEQNADRVRQNEEKIRVSASTEIPRAEIMKQIEKSVMKYMKELEAEGKILTAPQEAKTYYKLLTVPVDDKDLTTTTTIRPKYSSSTTTYHGTYNSVTSAPPSSLQHGKSASRHHIPKNIARQQQQHQYQAEAESAYQAPSLGQQSQQEVSEGIPQNVEFIYKIKTRAPLQTATVKTVSKPYSLPLKPSYEQFDHSAALKNIEEFDLSHVVTPQDAEERPSTNKPTKLYFNSEIYQDINSLPYKAEKTRLAAAEYRKLKEAELPAGYVSGYFAEPLGASADSEKEIASSSANTAEEGYTGLSPYQYIVKKEPYAAKYDESAASAVSNPNWEQNHNSAKSLITALAAQKALEYDSYSPKFNNNPEGYGYQHTYKIEREPHHKYVRHVSAVNNKRGKRGGGIPHGNMNKKIHRSSMPKDIEANIALRPPPKV